jgi:hypothetical protein
LDRRPKRLTDSDYSFFNNNNDLYSNRNDTRLYEYSSIDGDGKPITNGNSEFPFNLQRPDCQLNGRRCDKLYLDRRLSCNSNPDDTCFNNDNNIYGNRNAE